MRGTPRSAEGGCRRQIRNTQDICSSLRRHLARARHRNTRRLADALWIAGAYLHNMADLCILGDYICVAVQTTSPSRGCIHTSKTVSQKVHPSLTFTPKITVKYNPLSNPSLSSLKRQLTTQVNNTPIQALGVTLNEPLLPAHACSVGLCSRRNAVTVHFKLALARVPAISAAVWHIGTFLEHSDGATRS